MSDDEELLDTLLQTASEHIEIPQTSQTLRETDIFQDETPNLNESPKELPSEVHKGDTDSSDDEDNKNHDQRYNSYGKDIHHMLTPSTSTTSNPTPLQTWKSKPTNATNRQVSTPLMTDPIFGLKIINPLISSTTLKERMSDKDAVPFSRLKGFVAACKGKSDKNWVVAGVLVSKSTVKTTQKGQNYLIWTVSDLKDDIKTAAVFLFSSAYKQLWKTAPGTVMGILNPSVLERSDSSKDEACLSVDNPQKVIILGQSKDFGTCRSTRKNGDRCNAVVNLSKCEFCLFHIRQQYQKCSSMRTELQANFTGGGLTALRNKVLGKNEVFYAGQSYMAIPAKKSRKMIAQDDRRLQSLANFNAGGATTPRINGKKKQVAVTLERSHKQRANDLLLLEKLGGGKKTTPGAKMKSSAEPTLEESRNLVSEVLAKLQAKKMAKQQLENGKKSTEESEKSEEFIDFDKNDVTTKMKGKSDSRSIVKGSKNKTNNIEDNTTTTASEEVETNGECLLNQNDTLTLKDQFLDFDKNDVTTKMKGKSDSRSIVKGSKSKTEENTSTNTSKHSGGFSLNLNHTPTLKDPGTFIDFGDIPVKSKPVTPSSKLPKKSLKKSKPKGEEADNNKKNKVPILTDSVTSAEVEETTKSNSVKPHIEKINVTSPSTTLYNLDNNIPKLSDPGLSGNPTIPKTARRAKENALKYVRNSGPLTKTDPNSIKTPKSKKRILDPNDVGSDSKKPKLDNEFRSERFKKLMEASSKHLDLLAHKDEEEKEKYFNKLEMKERMEEKMCTTFKMACKAVKCLRCKYTSFSAADRCKEEKHPLKVFDATKRFFKCTNCRNRTVTLEVVPTKECNFCGTNSWTRTGMMEEKIVRDTHKLSIRGGEQKFVNSVAADSNLNLLVADE